MSTTVGHIICGKCKTRHETPEQVRACYYPPLVKLCMDLTPHPRHVDEVRNWTCPGFDPPATVVQSALTVEPPTAKQLAYIERLGGDVTHPRTKTGASIYIDRLKREGVKTVEEAPNRKSTKIPLPMLHAVPDGYYATRQDSTRPFNFFRFSRPKSGNFKGALKIQTQHGPDLKLALTIYPGDRIYWSNMAVEDDLLLVVVDTNGSAIAYSDEIGNCMRCNTELTDERSRWFGIGPECEKHWPQMIDLVTDRKGPFVHGWELKSE